AVLVALQPYARAARHFRQLLDRENHHLAVFADARDLLALEHAHRTRLVGRLHVEHLLALARRAETFIFGDDEAFALMACDYEPASAHERNHRDDVALLLEIDEQPHRLAMAAPTGQLRTFERVEAPVRAEHEELRG